MQCSRLLGEAVDKKGRGRKGGRGSLALRPCPAGATPNVRGRKGGISLCSVHSLQEEKPVVGAHLGHYPGGKASSEKGTFLCPFPPPPAGFRHPSPRSLAREEERRRGGEREERGGPPRLGRGGEWCQSAPSGAREKKSIKTLFFEGASSLLQPFVIQGILSPGIYPSAHICFFLCVERKKV